MLSAAASLIHRKASRRVIGNDRPESEMTMRTLLTAALIAIGLVQPAQAQTAAAQRMAASGQPVRAIGDSGRGEALVARWCGECHHGGDPRVASDQAPTIPWIVALARKDPAFIRTFLTQPHAPMPPLELDRGQIEDVIAYFADLAAR